MEKMHKRLTSAARCAIKIRSKGQNRDTAAKLLEHDLLNGPLHCFGFHEKCSSYFCSVARNDQLTHSSIPDSNPTTTSSSDCEMSDETSYSSNPQEDILGMYSLKAVSVHLRTKRKNMYMHIISHVDLKHLYDCCV